MVIHHLKPSASNIESATLDLNILYLKSNTGTFKVQVVGLTTELTFL